MAIGDAAAAAGMDLVSGTAQANTIETELNKSRDYIAQFAAGIRAVSAGGTGADTASGARLKLGAAAANHAHSWGDITGKPATFTPAAHSHAWADITAKPATFPPATHTHTWGSISGKPSTFANDDVDAATGFATRGRLVRWGPADDLTVRTPVNIGEPTPKKYVDDRVDAANDRITFWANSVTAALDGRLNASVYGREITSTRRSAWISSGGDLGYASSSRYKKQDFSDPELTLEQVLGIPVTLYRYRKAVAAERRGEGKAATEIGTIAEDLHDLGLWPFVMYVEGKPVGVHYELLALAAIRGVQHLAMRQDDLDRRLSALEGNAS